jgi:hypothetical protein
LYDSYLESAWFRTLKAEENVISWFPKSAFKCNLYRYNEVRNPLLGIDAAASLIQEEVAELLSALGCGPGATATAPEWSTATATATATDEPTLAATVVATATVTVPVLTGLLTDVDNIRCCVGSNVLDAEKLATEGELMPVR